MKKRESNLELLRIVSIFMIIVFHCSFKSGFQFAPGFSVNKLIVKTFWMLGELGVNLFILISGYFQVNGQFKWKKLIRLLLKIQFYHWITLLAACRLGLYQFTGRKDLFCAFFPITLDWYWFTTAYVLLYLFSPFLNIFLHAMDRTAHRKFLLLALTVYCVIPTVFGFLRNSSESMMYFNRFLWLVIVYCIGAYLRGSTLPEQTARRLARRTTWLAAAILVCSILVIDRFSGFFAKVGTTEPAYFWQINTLPMLLLSVGVFSLFRHRKTACHPFVNLLASTTLGIYLLHDGLLSHWIWGTVFRCAAYQDSPPHVLLVRILGSAAVVFLVCAAVDLLRQAAERLTVSRLLDSPALDTALRRLRQRLFDEKNI